MKQLIKRWRLHGSVEYPDYPEDSGDVDLWFKGRDAANAHAMKVMAGIPNGARPQLIVTRVLARDEGEPRFVPGAPAVTDDDGNEVEPEVPGAWHMVTVVE